MKKQVSSEPDMLPKYDFSKATRGKYAKRYAEGTNLVLLSPDLAPFFPNSDSVNAALRTLVDTSQQTVKSLRARAKSVR